MSRSRTIQQLYLSLLLSFLISCDPSDTSDKSKEKISIFFDEAVLGGNGYDGKLLIEATFSECGEWGGHEEKMIVFGKPDKEIYLNYRKFKVNCDSIGAYYGTPDFQKLEFEKILKLNEANKKSISAYILRMVKSKMKERFPGHAGNHFLVINSDSTLFIDVYDDKKYDVESYSRLLDGLNLSTSTE